MPTFDDHLRTRLRGAAPVPTRPDPPIERLAARKRRRAITRRVGTIGAVACILAAATAAFLLADRPPARIPVATPTAAAPLVGDLGLGLPVCDVSSLPISTALGAGTAAVYTQAADGGCPKQGHLTSSVGIDVDGDGRLDATSDELPDCYFPCEAFAAPDLSGDGRSEVMVSAAGADGYGVRVFAVETDPAAIRPVILDGEPLEFAWVDVYTHTSVARCDETADGHVLVLESVEKTEPADVTSTDVLIDGTTATVVGHDTGQVLPKDAPRPGDELCGAPINGSALDLAGAPGVDVGLGTNLCNVTSLTADFTGDGTSDVAWIGTMATDNRCPYELHRSIAAVDVTGDDLADAQTEPFPYCISCSAFATTDFNADGARELAVLLQSGTTPQYGIYNITGGPQPKIEPAIVNPGSEQFPEGDPLTFWTGGDEGFAATVECEGYPDRPVLIAWASNQAVDAPYGSLRDVVMTKLTMQPDGTFAAVDALHQQQAIGDPPLFDSSGKACGVDWNPFG